MNDLKQKIINYLNLGVPVSAFRFGITNEEFKATMSELKTEGKVTFRICYDKLPNGQPSPFYGDITDIRLIK